jgi:fused signal recognition particle receptor
MSIFRKFQEGLAKTSKGLKDKIQGIFSQSSINDDFLDELEAALISADTGIEAAERIVSRVKEKHRVTPINTEEELYQCLRSTIEEIMRDVQAPLARSESGPTVYVMVGVNGSGKTTTIGKLAKRWTQEQKSVIVAAADTFRAAAEDQLAVWAERAGATMIAHQAGSDPGAVAYDAVKAAIARKADLVIVDTAGRLHTKKNLMEEMKKIVRIISREIPTAPHEVLLVIDGTTGQNGLKQAEVFRDAVGVTGICVTKLDGSSKGGIAVAIAEELQIPVKLIGTGEGIDDLSDFDPSLFAKSMFPED